ncbi:MAG: DegT/DnrJ/EryC1/StrS aminotransferase family protein [Candidatus Krumholzibacteriia bacterium]
MNSCTAAIPRSRWRCFGLGPGDEGGSPFLDLLLDGERDRARGRYPGPGGRRARHLEPRSAAWPRPSPERTRAILPVHYAGHPCEMDTLEAIAERHGLVIVEDAAQRPARPLQDRWIGQADHPVCFSFYATKNLTTGEGGMLTGAPEFVDRARVASLHGMSRDAWKRYDKGGSWYYEVVMPGFKYNLPDVLAAIGLAQLRKLDRMQAVRRAAVDRYHAAFAGLPVQVPTERPEVRSALHLYPLRLLDEAPVGRDEFIEKMKEANIGTSVHFIPIHYHPYYREKYGWREGMYPVAEDAFRRVVSLPLHGGLVEEDQADVVAAVAGLLS